MDLLQNSLSLFQKQPSIQNINTSQLSAMPTQKLGLFDNLKSKVFNQGTLKSGLKTNIASGAGMAFDFAKGFAGDVDKGRFGDLLGTASNIAMAIPGGQAIGLGIKAFDTADSLFGKKESGTDDNMQSIASEAYSTDSVTGKKFGLFTGRKKRKEHKRLVARTDKQNAFKASNVQQSEVNDMLAQNTIGDVTSRNTQSLLGGLKTNAISAKQGAKILDLKNIKRRVLRKLETPSKIEDSVTMFKDGGKINVIPEGALHARKHNLDTYGDDITTKGIPVVSGDFKENENGALILQEGGEVTQHAEIEKNEIIFHKELTIKLEKLLKKYEEGDKDAAIEAGKLLTYEILENTNDNTGLLNEVQ